MQGDGLRTLQDDLRCQQDLLLQNFDRPFRVRQGLCKVRMLKEDHKQQRVGAAREFLQAHETDGEEFLDSPLHDTGNETIIPSVQTSRISEAAEI
ncbi:hypothetical protein Trydic_g6948 [Trypoxylus dichotomus]